MTKIFELNPDLGQVWTPDILAQEMTSLAFTYKPDAKDILDPACGPATFSKAINKTCHTGFNLTCYDIDSRMTTETKLINDRLNIKGDVILKDYLLESSLEESFDLIIMNPPYIRQEFIQKKCKEQYYDFLEKKLGVSLDKKSNLFALFLLKGIIDLSPNGILCAIVFDSIKNSAYGKKTLSLLDQHANLILTKTIKTPFRDVIIDAQLLLYQKREKPLSDIKKTYAIPNPNNSYLALGELLNIRRGTALPKRKAYIAEIQDKYYSYSKPFFIKQSSLKSLVIQPDQRIYLPDIKNDTDNQFLSWMNQRLESFSLPLTKRLIRPVYGNIAFNYYIRNAPRHLWNKDNVALSDNFYVANPKNNFPEEVIWLLLNSEQYLQKIIESARNQGNGLLKLQLYEYKNVIVPNWNLLPQKNIIQLTNTAKKLIQNQTQYDEVKNIATNLVKNIIYE